MRIDVAWRVVIFAPGILGGLMASGWQEGEAWMREGRRERMGRVDNFREDIVVSRVLNPSVLLSSVCLP